MTFAQRLARLTTTLAVRSPRLWRLLRAPFRRYFSRLAASWDTRLGPDHLDALAAALAGVPPPRLAVDLGTGTGAAAFLVSERFPDAEVIGLDVAPGMIAAAEAKTPPQLAGRVRFLEAVTAHLPLASGSCDLVTLVNTIPFFGELDRVLAPGGAVLVSFSRGAETPIWVPPERLREGFARQGFTYFEDVVVGAGTCLLARRA